MRYLTLGEVVSSRRLQPCASRWFSSLPLPPAFQPRRIAFHAFSKPAAQASTTASGWAKSGKDCEPMISVDSSAAAACRDRLVPGPEPRRPAGRVEGRRATRERDRVRHTRPLRERALEARERRALGDPVRGQRFGHRRDVVGLDRLVGIGQEREPHRPSTEERQFFHPHAKFC